MAAGVTVGDTGGMTAPSSTAVIRQWAREHGFSVGDRGRLSPEVLAAYATSGSRSTGAGYDKPAPTPVAAAGRTVRPAVRIPVQPRPGATGIGHRVTARIN
jgi:hypothetical protein